MPDYGPNIGPSFQEADRLARAVGAISANEELEDVATADLKFVLTNFYLGALELKGE